MINGAPQSQLVPGGVAPPPQAPPPGVVPPTPSKPAPGGLPPSPLSAAPAPQAPPMPQQTMFDQGRFDAAVMLLRNQKMRGFRIDIETDSTIAADQAQERQDVVQLTQSIGAFMQSAVPMVQSMPQLLPLVGTMLQIAIRRFSLGPEIEGQIDDMIEQLEAAGPPQNPAAGKGAAEAQVKQADLALKQQQMQFDQQRFAIETQQSQQKNQVEMARAQVEAEGNQLEFQGELTKANAELRKQQLQEQMAQLQHRQASLDHVLAMHEAAGQLAAAPAAPQKLEFGQGFLTKGDR